ncbi:MAG: POTRA domain-containing protein [Nodosilinea sp.]
MRVSLYLSAVLATSGLVGLAAPARANPNDSELHPESSESSQTTEAYSNGASSLVLPKPDFAPEVGGPTPSLNSGVTQAVPEFSPVADGVQSAIDDYRPSGQAVEDNTTISADQQPAAEPSLEFQTQLAQTPSTQREITPEEAQRILEGAVERRNQQQQTIPPEAVEPGDETVEESNESDESVEESSETPVEEAEAEPRVLVAEVDVQPTQGDLDASLENLIYSVIETQAGRTTTRTQLQQDINSIFATGFFADVDARPEDTDLGVRVTFLVQPNPVLTDVRVEGNEVLPQAVIDDIFDDQKGEIINLIDFQEGILELNQWYQDEGYVIAQVVAAPQVSPDGVVTLEVAEGVIESIEVRYINDLGQSVDDDGNIVQGRTRPFIITREFGTEPGDVFNQSQIEEDFQRVFGLGILRT